MRRISSAAFGGLVLLALGGCLREDQNALVVFGPDSAVVLAPLTIPAFLRAPEGGGQITQLVLVDFDVTQPDAFGRSSEPFSDEADAYPLFIDGEYWAMGGDEGTRPIATADDDPRKPLLTLPGASLEWDFLEIGLAGMWADPGDYDFWGAICCLTPGATYVAGLERLALQVNAELDAEAVLLGQLITEPDSLFRLGGAPGGDYTRAADLYNTDNPYPAEANANPFIFGYVSANVDGEVWLDAVVSATDAGGDTIWMPDTDPNQDLAVLAPNQLVSFDFPNYNYLTFWETNPDGSPDYSRPLARYQMGVDLDANGDPINNALAPFPDAALSSAGLAMTDYALSRPDSVRLRFDNIAALDGSAVYQVWAMFDDGSTEALDFMYANIEVLVVGEDTIVPPTAASSFAGGDYTHEVTLEYPGDIAQENFYLFLTVEDAAGATTPSPAQPVWVGSIPGAQDFGVKKSLSIPTIRFGTFGLNVEDDQRLWAISGTGMGGLFGDEFRARYEHLPRPPVGYKYVAWLASGDTLFERLPDETFTSPPPEYAQLESADTDTEVSDVVQPRDILAAMTRICIVQTAGCQGPYPLGDYDSFFLTLEPRAGVPDEPGPTRVLEGVPPTPQER